MVHDMAGGRLVGASMPLVLLVEDDLPLADMLRAHLGADEYVNLLAVDGPLNMQKGDGDAATRLGDDIDVEIVRAG
jgi:DNA-binding response OmpR family regulator